MSTFNIRTLQERKEFVKCIFVLVCRNMVTRSELFVLRTEKSAEFALLIKPTEFSTEYAAGVQKS